MNHSTKSALCKISNASSRIRVIIEFVASSFCIVENPDEKTWDDFVSAHAGHLLQTTSWGELKSRFGWSAQRVAVKRDGAIVAGAQILYRQLPLGLTLAYVPRGPACDPNDRDLLAALSDAVYAAVRGQGAFAVKIEPNWESPTLTPAPPLRSAHLHLTAFGAVQVSGATPAPLRHRLRAGVAGGARVGSLKGRVGVCIQPHTTIHVDLTRDLDTILAEMKPKWRYNIRLAERKGITVREGNAIDLPKFYELLQITSRRDAFPIHTLDYYRTAYELLTACDYARLFVAEYANETIAAIFVTAFGGEAIYLYGASGNAHRERMPNHALHWHAMQWAKARGCRHYDLWGVGSTAEADLRAGSGATPQSGLYQFKQGFGAHVVRYAGAQDVIFSRWKFALYERAVAFRRGAMG